MNLRTSDEHIHSHQDETLRDPEDPIPWKVQINTRCDVIATAHLRRQSHPVLLVPFLPASKVALTVNNRTITSRLPSQLRHICGSTRAYSTKRSQIQHLQRIHNWSHAQFLSIDWEVFSTVTNKKASFNNRMFKIRWVNHVLPLLHRQHRMNLSPSAHCPSDCGSTDEDESHLLCCPHPDRRLNSDQLLRDLRSMFATYNLDPWLRQILFSYISVVLPSLTFNFTALTPAYHALVAAQAELGPHALFYGIFHSSWVQLQDNYLQHMHLPNDKHQARRAIETLAHHFQATARRQWDTRNGHLHDESPSHQPSYSRILLQAETRQIYNNLPQLLFLDRPAITNGIPLADRLQFPTLRLRQWIEHVRPIIRISLKQAATRPAHTPDIRSFFPHGRPPEPPRPSTAP